MEENKTESAEIKSSGEDSLQCRVSQNRRLLIDAQSQIRAGKNSLVMAAMALDQLEGFEKTIAELKNTIGDLLIAEKMFDGYID